MFYLRCYVALIIMTELQEKILNGAIKMYDNSGEMIPTKLFNETDLEELVKLNKIKIVNNPYGIGDDFFGVVGKSYPIGFNELCDYRSMKQSFGDNEMARNLCKCITL